MSRGTLGYSLHSACMSFKRSGATGTWPGTNLNYNCEQVGIHPKFGAAVGNRPSRSELSLAGTLQKSSCVALLCRRRRFLICSAALAYHREARRLGSSMGHEAKKVHIAIGWTSNVGAARDVDGY